MGFTSPAKRPLGGVFLCSSAFWLSFGLVVALGSFLSADHYRPWVNFHAEALSIAGVLIAAFAVVAGRREVGVSRFWVMWTAVALAIAVAQKAILPGIFWGDVVVAWIFLSAMLAAVLVGNHLARDDQALVRMFALFAAVSTLSALIGILQSFSLSDFLGVYGVHNDFGDRAMGNLAQPNQLGTLLLMGLAAHAFLFERRLLSGFTFTLLLAVSTLALALTQSRTALLGATAISIYAVIAPNRLRIGRVAPLVWLGVFWGLFLAIPALNEALLIGGGRNVALMSSNSRDIVWKQVVFGIAQQPWLGFGWNRTATAHMAAAATIPGELTFTYAHNVVLDFLAWYGIPVGLALMLACAYWAWTRGRRPSSEKALFACAALIPLVIHSLLEFPFAYAYFLVVGSLLLGVVDGALVKEEWRIPKALGFLSLGAVSVVGAIVVVEYLQVEEDFRVARFSNMRIGRLPEGYEYSKIHILTQMGEMIAASRIQPDRSMRPEDIALLKRVANRFPYGALTYRYVEALALNDRLPEARQELEILKGLYGPMYFQAIQVDLIERAAARPELLPLVQLKP